ncbi:MAG: lamin tail domain-containing protein [bacterium]|nr:lamin tail domain-containing protein [bacterium]
MTKKYPLHFLAVVIGFFLLPVVAAASVSITEIMYDPAGSDIGSGSSSASREWIEIHNDGDADVDISSFKFRENDTDHGLSLKQGSAVLSPGGYAVIASSDARFLEDFPAYGGALFDSSFSLHNTGETLAIKDAEGIVIDSVAYESAWGAQNDGNSLQKSGGSFIAALPTPGSAAEGASAGSDPSSSTPTTTPVAENNPGSNWPVEPQVFANAGPNRVTIIGADIAFEAKAWGLQNKPLENARYVWNFGDGTVKEGKKTMHAYRYAGEYIVTLDVASGYFTGSDRVKVSVENSKVLVSSLGSGTKRFVEIKNGSGRELDISGWALTEGGVSFFFPERTFIGGNQKLIFPKEVTGIPAGNDVSLLYPNGSVADRYAPGRLAAAAPTTAGNPPAPAPVIEEALTASANVAAAAGAADGYDGEEGMPSVYKWLAGAIALALVAAFGTARLPRPVPKSGEISADDFTIIEEKD